MNQSTSFAQVATNLLNVLQGYTKGIRFVAVLTVLLTIGVGSMWGATTTYTFTSNKWADSSNGWTSGKDGVAYLNSGVQVTEKGTGAYATSNTSFTNISKIDVKYCTNASKGAGTIVLTVGSTSKTLTISKNGGTTMRTISASFDPNVSGTIKITVNCTTNSIYIGGITITTVENAKPHTVTLNAGPGTCAAFVTETSAGDGVTLPEPTLDCGNWKFAGWATSPVEEEITKAPKFITDKPYKPSGNITLYAVYQRTETIEGVETTTTTTDILTRETTGVTDGSTTYSSWSGKTVTSSAVYAGNSAGSNNSIQLRSNNSNSGVITTDSGGKAKKVTVEWQSSTASGRTLDIYGKNSAYSAATDLYSTSTQGTKLGSIVNGTSTELTITGDYEYIGLRSNSGAMYLTSISIDWATTTNGGASTTYYHSTPECTTKTSVTLNPNGGTISASGWMYNGSKYTQIVETTSDVILPTPNDKTGYTFNGWYENSSFTGSSVTKIAAGTTGNKEFWAKWTAKQTQLLINANTANHGSGSGFSVVATYGEALPNFNPCTPATGYTLNGYYTEATSGTKIVDKDGKLVSNVSDYTSADGKWASEAEQLILYAQYIINTYTVKFDNQGHGTKPDNQTINHGGKVNNPGNLTDDGFIFGGWYKEEGCSNAWNFATDVVTSGTTLYAKWTPIEYQITYEGLGGASNEDNPRIYTIESETITFEEPGDRAGYIFKRWEPATIEKGSTGPVTVTAKWCELLGDATELAVDLNFINEEDGETYVKFSWTPADNTKSHATKQVICIGKVGEEKKCTDLERNQVWSGNLRSKLTPGEYEWTIQAIGDGETYCDGEVISGPNFTIEEPLTDNCRWVETEIGDIESGDEVVIAMTKSGYTWALNSSSSNGTTTYPLAEPITIKNQTIDSDVFDPIIWNISGNATDGYVFYPNGSASTWLYCIGSNNTVKVGTGTAKTFYIENNYLKNTQKLTVSGVQVDAYVGVSISTSSWRHYPTTTGTSVIADQTLKFYKKTCLPANKFWIDYELANVTCTNTPPPSQIDQTGEDLLLEFSANDGYKLPEQVSITMGGNTLSEEAFDWDAEEGILYIVPEDGITGDIVITIEGCELLAIPTNLKANNITSSSATLSWDEIDHATEYQVHITDDDDSTEDIITTTSNTYYEVTGLSSASEYLWGVTPIASGYCGLTQEAEIFTTLDVYTVTFNTNGGTAVEPQNIDHGGKAAKPTDPIKTGYKFAGWYTEADTEFNFNTPIESATTLYAKWTANQYTITLRQQWGDGGTETATVHFNNNDFSVNPITVPTRNGYTFGGYYTSESGAGTQLIDVSGAWLNAPNYIEGGKWVYADNLTLYAKWTQNFTITWMANGQPYHSQTAMMGTAIAKPDDPDEFACNDKVFVGWLDKTISGSTNEEPTFVTDFGTIQAAETYHAVFATLTGTPSNDYNKITDINDLTDGEYVIAYGYNTTSPSIILTAETRNETTLVATSATPTNNKYTSPAAENIWEIKKTGTTYTLFNAATSQYIQATNNPTLELSNSNPTEFQISYSTDHWKIKLNDATTYQLVGYTNSSGNYFQTKSGASNSYKVQLYKNASTAVYSDYVTTCVEIPTPHWEGAEIDNADIAVDCGTISYKTNASTITFPTDKNYDLTYPITLTASEGFLLSTNKQNDVYEQSVTVTPVQSDDNKGKITQSVHVRADATGKKTDFDGTITISGDQLAEDQIIEVHAVVDCPQYTLTFNDQGQTQTVEGFAGTSVVAPEPWAGICTEPIQYVFDGWAETPVANGTEEYEKINFSTYTMPGNNTTVLYAVYRYAEEGGEPVDGFVKVTEALSDWTGDYVIVNETAKKAIGNAYKTDTKNDKTLIATDVTIIDNKIHNPTDDVIWQIRKSGLNYTMYNADASKYAYITGGDSENAGLSDAVQYINISWGSSPTTVRVIGSDYSGRCFSYYTNGNEWRTYAASGNNVTGALYKLSNKSLLYTSSLICGEISVEKDNVVVTSTKDQTVKVYVPITLKYSGAASITGTSDNEAFTVVTKNDVAVGESTIEVHYKPTAYVNTANQEETATITLTTSNGATTTFNVTGRCLPETFAIVAKVGNVWYALPSQGLNSTTPPIAYPVEVDNMADPTAVVSVPANADWSLRQVYASSGSNDRFADNGENLVFVNNASPAMALNASQTGNYLLADAQYNNYYSTYPGLYEWTPTTTDLETYTLTNAQRTDRTLNVATNTVFGVHSDNKATTEVRFLPITGRYTPAALQVVEWKENSVVIMYNGNPAQTASVSVNGAAAQNTTLSAAQRDIAVYELAANGLAANPTQRLSITIGSEKTILSIPYIINSETTDAAILPDGTVAARQEVAKVSDLVILKDATLTAAGAKGNPYKFRNVTVYGGGKLVVPAENGFGVNSLTLRIGGVTADGNYDYVYPEFVLNTNTKDAYTNTSGKINLDYVTTKEQYYTFVAPFAVSTKDIKYPVDIYGSNVEAANRGSFEFQYYDGEARANGEKGWKVVAEDPIEGATLTAHKGYTFYGMPRKVTVNGETTRQKFGIHRIPMTETAANVMSHENNEQTVAISAHPSEKNINSGWNLIGNPYMSTITGLDNQSIVTGTIVMVDNRWEWSNEDTYNQRFIVFPSNDGEWYYTSQASNATLPAFKNFFVQIANNEKATTLAIPRNTAMVQLLAPARRTAEEIEHDIEMAIVLEKDDAYSDQLDFLINDTYGAGFDYNADFTKMMNATNLNLYGVHMDDNLSFVALDHYSARGSVAIGYQVPAAGEYTLRISDKPYVMWDKIEALYVTDHEMNPAVTTNLMEEDYVFHVGKAEINDTRFTISLTIETNTNGDDITTNMGEVDIHSKQPQKFFYNSKLYILRDGKIYSATGHEIQTINK